MSGPYSWEPPNYFYGQKLGGAFGFLTEVHYLWLSYHLYSGWTWREPSYSRKYAPYHPEGKTLANERFLVCSIVSV